MRRAMYRRKGENRMAVDLLSVSLRDEANQRGSVIFYWPAGTATLAEVQLFVDGVVPNIDAMSGAVIESASVSLGMVLPGPLKGAPVAGHNIQNGANIAFALANSQYTHSIRMPAVLESLIVPGSDIVDMTGTNEVTFINDVVSGVGPVMPTNQFGIDITSFINAVRTFRRG